MRKNLLITILMYALLLAGCFAIVYMIDRIAGYDPYLKESEQLETISTETDTVPETASEDETSPQTKGEETIPAETPVTHHPRQTWYPWESTASDVMEKEETKKEPPMIILATDLHYMSPESTDYGEAFETLEAGDDGKVLRYASEFTDAFLNEVLEKKPTALVLSGDITLNGEKINHQELAKKLKTVQDAGIQVLVIPGNHDINNHHSATYFGKEKESAESITPEEFYAIYREFGYDRALSRDEDSLSYLYRLDEKNWLLMLDSCQYSPINLVGGKIRDKTYDWMELQFEKAGEEGVTIIPIAHHNLLKESRVYTSDCDIEGGERLIAILEKWKVPVFLSGHLHLQRVKKFYDQPGTPKGTPSIYEVVTGSTSIAPCQYAIVTWSEAGDLQYRKKAIDVSAWAKDRGNTDVNLLNFTQYSVSLLEDIVSKQIFDQLSNLQDEQKIPMSLLYGKLNRAYCAGEKVPRYQVVNDTAYALWDRNRPDSSMFEQIEDMMSDLQNDDTSWDFIAVK